MQKTYALSIRRGVYIKRGTSISASWNKDVECTSDVNEALVFASAKEAKNWYEQLFEGQFKRASIAKKKAQDDLEGGVSVTINVTLSQANKSQEVPPFVARYAYYKKLWELVGECFGLNPMEGDFSNPYFGGQFAYKMEHIRTFETFLRQKMHLEPLKKKTSGKVDALKEYYDQSSLIEGVFREYCKEYECGASGWRIIVPHKYYQEEERFAKQFIVPSWDEKMVEEVYLDEAWVQKATGEGFSMFVVKSKNCQSVQHGFVTTQAGGSISQSICDATFFDKIEEAQEMARKMEGSVLELQVKLKRVHPNEESKIGVKMKALIDKSSLELMNLGQWGKGLDKKRQRL